VEDHIGGIARIALVAQRLARRKAETLAGEREQLELRGLELREQRDVAQDVDFFLERHGCSYCAARPANTVPGRFSSSNLPCSATRPCGTTRIRSKRRAAAADSITHTRVRPACSRSTPSSTRACAPASSAPAASLMTRRSGRFTRLRAIASFWRCALVRRPP